MPKVPGGSKEYSTRQHHVLATTGKAYSGNDLSGKHIKAAGGGSVKSGYAGGGYKKGGNA